MSFTQYLPSYTMGADAYQKVGEICRPYGSRAALIGGMRAREAGRPRLLAALEGSGIEITADLWYGGEASLENAQALAADPLVQAADMIFAMGGGKAMDACKYACQILGKPLFTFPTIAATCAAASTEAIMYWPGGEMREVAQLDRPARQVFIDTQVIADAPDIYLWAGIGDTLSKRFETEFSVRGREITVNDAVAVDAARQCYKPLVRWGEEAMAACRENRAGQALENICLTIIITTGLVSNLIDYHYNCSVAHAVYDGFTWLPEIEGKRLHGEVVAYGVLVMLTLDGNTAVRDELYPLYRAIKLPTCLADLEVAESRLDIVVEKAATSEDIECTPYAISQERLRQAIMDLEEYSRRQLSR